MTSPDSLDVTSFFAELMKTRAKYHEAREALKALAPLPHDDAARLEVRRKLVRKRNNFRAELAATAGIRARLRAVEGDRAAEAAVIEYALAARRERFARATVKKLLRRAKERAIKAQQASSPLSQQERTEIDARIVAAKDEARAASSAFEVLKALSSPRAQESES